MARRVKKIRNADLAAALRSGLELGLFTVSDAIHVMRALEGISQRALAERVGVTTKVIKAIESGSGDPHLDTLTRIATAAGLRVAFVSRHGSVGLLRAHARAEQSQRRRTSARELQRGNALEFHDVSFELRSLA